MRFLRRPRVWIVAAILVTFGLAAGWQLVERFGTAADVAGSSTEEFDLRNIPDPVRPPPAPPGADLSKVVSWPTYGFGPERARISPFDHRPPFARAWSFGAGSLLEFPPALAYEKLFVTNLRGSTFALDTETGRQVWRRDENRCAASTPAVAAGLVIQVFLNPRPCNSGRSPSELEGIVVAYEAESGQTRWRYRFGPSESSPLVVGNRVIVGDWRGDVVALELHSGRKLWSFHTGGRVKGAVAASGNRAFVGAYDGRVYALNLATGALQWSTSSQSRLGGRGRFYSTPAVAYGRVYIGSTDGKVYSFGAASGELRWSRSTGGYVYSSPAVWNRTVFAGSYSRELYALDAATGAVRWRFRANGPISGSATVMGGQVWFSTLERRTYVLDARTGRQVWTFPDGEYTPLAADADRVYLVGYARIYALEPRP
ncbi:MAG: PQQ-binding-like beta-propeller repeat protein [Gaiellales bacterium]